MITVLDANSSGDGLTLMNGEHCGGSGRATVLVSLEDGSPATAATAATATNAFVIKMRVHHHS